MKEIEMIEKVQLSLVKEFEGMADYYQVCREGDRCWVLGKDGRVLKASDSRKGYRQIGLMMQNGKQKWILEHRLFAICFLPNLKNLPVINHIDGVKDNNLLSNLEWDTYTGNNQKAYDTGLKKAISGDDCSWTKIKDSEIPLIFNMRKSGLALKAIGLHFGVDKSQISRILSGKQRSQYQ
jgi:hypothetical protein